MTSSKRWMQQALLLFVGGIEVRHYATSKIESGFRSNQKAATQSRWAPQWMHIPTFSMTIYNAKWQWWRYKGTRHKHTATYIVALDNQIASQWIANGKNYQFHAVKWLLIRWECHRIRTSTKRYDKDDSFGARTRHKYKGRTSKEIESQEWDSLEFGTILLADRWWKW